MYTQIYKPITVHYNVTSLIHIHFYNHFTITVHYNVTSLIHIHFYNHFTNTVHYNVTSLIHIHFYNHFTITVHLYLQFGHLMVHKPESRNHVS
jgi:hypothetical protein